MEIGVAIAILICIGIILLILFYLVTRYFNRRLQKKLQNQAQIYSMVDGIQANREDFMDGQYSDFAESRIRQWKRLEGERKKVYLDIAHEGNIKQPLFQNQFNIYKKTPLQIKLDSHSVPLAPESVRSSGSIKTFSVERLESFRSTNSIKSNQMQNQMPKNKNINDQIIRHKFISKLVSYTNEGISVINNEVTDFWRQKQNQQIHQKRKVSKKFISKNEQNFFNCLEAYGFEQDIKGAFIFQLTVQIVNMRPQIVYSIQSLRTCQTKSEIQLNQFYKLVSQLQQGD